MRKSWKCITHLLYVVPFVNICNNRGAGVFIMSFMAVCLLFLFLYTIGRYVFSPQELIVKRCGFRMCLCVCLLTIVSLIYGIGNFYSIRFFCLFPFFILIFTRVPNIKGYIRTYFIIYLRYLVVLITCSIVIDYILMSIGLLTMQPMYSEEQYAYTTRPFGLFGQPSVNSSLLCLFYILHFTLVKRYRINYSRDWLFIVMTIGCLVQGSGSGFISYGIAFLCKYGTKNKINISIKRFIPYAIITVVGLVAVIMSNKVHKLSLDYINVLIEYTKDDLWYPYLQLIGSPVGLWFGMKEFPLSIDFGPLYLVGTVGLFYFIVMTIFCLTLYFRAVSAEMKLCIVLLLVGNLHYPVMFYFIMNVIWFFICYIILVIEHEKV